LIYRRRPHGENDRRLTFSATRAGEPPDQITRKGLTAMAKPNDQDHGDAELVFAAHNLHDVSCGSPPRLRITDSPALYHGYFENCHREQFVFTFDRATGTGTVSGGDLGWDHPKPFTLGRVEKALRAALDLAAQIHDNEVRSKLPVIDAALALGNLTGLTGKEEVSWLRACLQACTAFAIASGSQPMR
jgi:hypothetical protein